MRQTTAIATCLFFIFIATVIAFAVTDMCIKAMRQNFVFDTILSSTLVWATAMIMIIVILLVVIAIVLAIAEKL
jgi:putative exporter of polyketide antibiotics